jgi:hypothetical protein
MLRSSGGRVRRGAEASWARRALGGAAAAAALASALACAAKQRVPLDCVPRGVEIYVDEELLAGYPVWVNLRADQAHKIKFRGPGYEPVLVVLDPRESEEGTELLVLELGREVPEYPAAELCTHLRFVPIYKELEIEVESPR